MLADQENSIAVDNNKLPLGRLGSLETRLACTPDEISKAQKLRYQVFYEELGAHSKFTSQNADSDRFDAYCDHLLVLDNDKIVGTYRLLPQDYAEAAGGFYSQSEFDVSSLAKTWPEKKLLELGRSCISPAYRKKRTMELLWHGTWAYALHRNIDVMFGCSSFPTTDPTQFAEAFAWLNNNARLPKSEDCGTTSPHAVDLGQFQNSDLNLRKVWASLPPMLKGYLRLGAKVSGSAVTDHAFGTTDVLVLLKVADINPRYIAHYGANASRYAA